MKLILQRKPRQSKSFFTYCMKVYHIYDGIKCVYNTQDILDQPPTGLVSFPYT